MTAREDVVEALKTVMDPELYIDVWTLGLIYDIDINGSAVDIRMTFTSVACPLGPELVDDVRQKILTLEGVEICNVEVVFDPPWKPSDELKAMLGIL
ncbi:MAG: metal-sulfur cluster assembly factor [Deltaproteobacteria bacterium]|nr:metal-sulfur cluster assembly factor [Deltaproteobacteria bacterium]